MAAKRTRPTCSDRQVEAIFKGVGLGLDPASACSTAGTTLAAFHAWLKRNRPGRRTRCTPETVELVLRGISKGLSFARSCDAAHIDRDTRTEWLERARTKDRDPDGRFAHFAQLEIFSTAEAELSWLTRMEEPPSHDKPAVPWVVWAWKLERRNPAEYARTDRHELTGKDGGPIEHRDIDGMTPEQRHAEIDSIRHELGLAGAGAPAPAASAGTGTGEGPGAG